MVAERLHRCGPLVLEDLSSCGRYLVLSCRSETVPRGTLVPSGFRHGRENIVVLCDADQREKAIVCQGPTPEVPVAADSHLFISRDDPSYVWFGSYTRRAPTGFKTVWSLSCDVEALAPRRNPEPLFDQRPQEFVNHYYPAPNARVQMPLYQYTEWDRDGVPVAALRKSAVSRTGNYLAMMLDVSLNTRLTHRWLFPRQPPLHFKGNKTDDLWAGDCADSGFLWFLGRDLEDERMENVDPEECPSIPENHEYHWRESGAWIGVFKKRDHTWKCVPWCTTERCDSTSTLIHRFSRTTGGSYTVLEILINCRCSLSKRCG